MTRIAPRLSGSRRPLAVLPAVALTALLAVASMASANSPPVISAPTDVQRDPGQSLIFNVNTSDPDGDSVTLEGANVPAGARFLLDGNGNAFFSWTPTVDDVGYYVMNLIATDDGDPVERTTADVAITIGDPNLPPVLDPIGDQMATVGLPLFVPLTATDPEGAPLVFSMDPPVAGAVIEPTGDASATFEYVPVAGDVGNVIVTFFVSDGIATDEEMIAIVVDAPNVPPTLEPIGDRQMMLGEDLVVELMADDADPGDALSFFVQGAPGGVSLFDRGDGTAQLSGKPDAAGLYAVTVTVSDDGSPSESAFETFDVDVQALPSGSELVILDAHWKRRKLHVSGEGALPGAPVTLRDAATGWLLGEMTADSDGLFDGWLRPYVPPCSVEASSDGATSAPVAVEKAPASCSRRPGTRVVSAVWRCRKGLGVFGVGAPQGATVRVFDASSDALMGVTTAGRSGVFALKRSGGSRPDAVRVEIEAGDLSWTLAPKGVRGGNECGVQSAAGRRHH